MKKELLPSDVKDIVPQMSIWFDYNKEIVAMWTARALAETGNTWRKITWEEIEPLITDWDESNRLKFRRFFPTLDSEEKARRISSCWNL